ncbi:hypothetical protein BDV27DRAFT_171166 [Aspergillus caelatus]|uniref:histidine kinase n=1 Tax=Aspergillus caelatus TaxID=61420 RepID=A0A5N7A842_9EURO|nr:uncharacterized protein BDV27DRAFT_171166 [Aspergillus caelatus]KAE8366021.1 hypothetical protein BDV27DRAFT_171166 [Aspergillus caelatus]
MHSILSRLYRPESSIGTDGSRDEPAASPTYLRKPPSTQNAAGDTILTGLAELGAYRVDCHHAFVTLLENNEPYVIAEAIIPHIVKKDENGKSSLLGLKTLGLKADGSYPTNGFKEIPNDGCHIVLDICSDHTIGGHPFVTQCSDIRFYAEVPLRSSAGDIFGTYCVTDSAPRSLFADGEVDKLKQVASSIAGHLENIWTLHKCRKSERLLGALTEFAKGQPPGDNERNSHSGRGSLDQISHRSSELPDIDRISLSTDTTHDKSGTERPKPKDRAHSPSFFKRSDVPMKAPPSPEKHQQHARRFSDVSSNLITVSEGVTSSGTSALFSQASMLLRECMKLDGVVFLDASRSNSRSFSTASVSDWDDLSKDTDTSAPLQSPGLSSQGPWSEKQCDMLGCALSEDLLGHDFPESKSLIFLPLWNWDKSRWLAGAIVWMNDKQRPLGADDLCYLRAFGDSVVAKFSQLGWSATEKSKSDLLSSVSHELRSPLHGMLASAELLQTTRLEPAQRDMLTMVETCGLTLLDTMNYLLDFTKVNNLTHIHKAGEASGSAYDNLTTDFDLGTLIEDVSETLYAGHRSLINAAKIAGRYLPSGAGVGNRSIGTEIKQLDNPDDLSVVVRIEEQKSWSIHSVSGGWRRIVMNILGNSFKFTRSGLIEVSLSKEVEGVGDQKTTLAHLSVKDTGCGIESEFLEHQLYKPFAQEDVLTEGCGLGLPIVHQIVTNLGGYVEVHSQVGVGTQVDVHVPIEYAVQIPPPSAPLKQGERPGSRIMTRVCLIGLNPYAELKGARKGVITTEAKRKLSIRGALSNVLLSQPGWMVSFADSLDKGSGDIGVVEESSLKKIAEAGPIDTQFTTIIVLGEHGVSLPGNFAIKNADIIYVSQPLGPRKLNDALQRFIDAHREASPLSESPVAGPFSGFPGRGRSLSAAFAAAKGSESPPMVRENVAELSPFPTPQALNQKNIHVLIVDDNDILATFMRKIGCSYETATNGLAALEKYKACAGQFDYVLMDISMPIMDGIVSTSKIREYEEQNSLPRSTIMAVTGVASSSVQQQAFAAGVDDYLVKPLSLHDLKRIMSVE